MITANDVAAAMPMAERLFPRLQQMYLQLPETRCECREPGACCLFLPEMTVLEALQWIRLMRDAGDSAFTDFLRRFVRFYLTNPVRLTGCPFMIDGLCTIYAHRTFGCRAYGLWSQKIGIEKTRENRRAKRALLQIWKRFGLELPPECVTFEMDYCDKVRTPSGKNIKDHRLMDFLSQIYMLGKDLGDLQNRFEAEYHSDFSFLLTTFVFGMKESLLLKFAVIKESVQSGTDKRLQQALETVSADILRF
jgi:Fe-S-cluster containining protein